MTKIRNAKASNITIRPDGEIYKYSNQKYVYTEVLRQDCAIFYTLTSESGDKGTAVLECKKNTLTVNYQTGRGDFIAGVLYNIGKGKYRGTRIMEGTGATSCYEVQFC